MRTRNIRCASFVVLLCFVCSVASAAGRYWDGTDTTGDANGGSGNWDNGTTANWDDASTGGGSVTWANATPDNAYFGGANGTATLGEDITIKHMRFTAGTHTVAGNTLNFAASGSITTDVNNVDQTITSGINGEPSVAVASNTSQDNGLKFAPTATTQSLGVITMAFEDGSGDKCAVTLAGTTVGNTVISVGYDAGHQWANLRKDGSSTWTVGNIDNGTVEILDGNFIANGEIYTRYRGIELKGGVFHYNNAGAGKGGAVISFLGGSLDNSSGAAITTSTYNPANEWEASWMFIGSQGANSDLNMGVGAVTLKGNYTVTVSNSAATLIIGGVITDSTSIYGLTKKGAGTLRLTGVNTYNGSTLVDTGTLSITQAYLDNNSTVSVSNGAVLNLDFAGTDDVFYLILGGSPVAAGTWGRIGHPTAANTSALLTGDGLLNNVGGVAPAGTWYWDGPNTGGTGDGASAGGTGTWSTAVANWDKGFVAREVWNNTASDKAIFRTTVGVVDLQSDITLGEILIEGVDNYVIGSTPETQVLNFGGSNKITVDQVHATIRAGITGSPDVHNPGGFRKILYFRPGSASMTLGELHIGKDSTSNPEMHLLGSTTGNSAVLVQAEHSYGSLTKDESGTWTVGDVTVRDMRLKGGALVINGTLTTSGSLSFTGGTLGGTGTINDPVTVPVGCALAPGNPTGTMTVTNNNCTINGDLDIVVSGASYSSLDVGVNMLTISSAALDVNVTSLPSGPVVIATYGTLIGEFTATNNLPADWSIDYNYESGNQIALIPPAAGTVFLFQ